MEGNGFLEKGSTDDNEDGQSLPTEITTKNSTRSLKCLIVGIIVSVVLLASEIWCLVSTVESIYNLNTGEARTTPLTSSSLQSSFQHSTVPCNRSTPCYVVEDDIYTKLAKLFNGAKRQTQIRKQNKKQTSVTRQNCEQLSLANCSDGYLRWRSEFHGNHGKTNGSVIIKQSGTYGMFNIFTLKSRNAISMNMTEVTHRIHRKKRDDDSKVLFERKVVMKPQNQSFKTSSFFEFVDLHKGDQVFPSLSDISFLFESPKANVWGVFLIR